MKTLAISSMLLLAVACKHEQIAIPPAHTAQCQESPMPGNAQSQQEITWVCGRVSDEQGRPIANATVYALATYFYGLRRTQIALHTPTDQRGYYELKGLGWYEQFSLTLLATAPGRAPAWAWPEVEMDDARESHSFHVKRGAPPVEDFVLSSSSGKFDVTVLQAGKPVMGANVAIYLRNAPL